MKAEELVRQLNTLGVNKNSYSLGNLFNNDCTCIIKEGDVCFVYYVERDNPFLQASFAIESDACDYVLMQFNKWLS